MSRKTEEELRAGRHFCILPWISFSLHPQGELRPCCSSGYGYSYGSVRTRKIESVWNDEPARKMRLELLRDRPVPQCQGCYHLERIGAPSQRQDVNARFGSAFERIKRTRKDGSVPLEPFLYLDLRFSNVCNFKCRICRSEYSVSWAEDERKLGRRPAKRTFATKSPQALREFLNESVPFVQRVYFAGGEPLMEEEHYLFLEKLLAAGRTDVELIYNSNFSMLSHGKWNALELWSRFRSVAVLASLDGVGPQGEYLRKGMVWPRIEENFWKLRQLAPHVHFAVYSTITAMNAFHLTDAIRHWLRIGMITELRIPYVNALRSPNYLHIGIFSGKERAALKRHYRDFLKSIRSEISEDLLAAIESCLQQVLGSYGPSLPPGDRRDLRHKFAFETSKLDAIRGESFQKLFPELSELVGFA